jgi:ABC-type amino acid transport substrate-binding protein
MMTSPFPIHAGLRRWCPFLTATVGVACFLVACATAKRPGPSAAALGKPLRVGINATMPPLAFKEGGQFAGIEPDFAFGLAKHLNRPVVFVELAWADLLPALGRGRVDIVMSGMSITPQRQAIVDFSPPYLETGLVALLRRDQEEALGYFFNEKVKIGVKPGTTGEFYVQQNHPRNPVTRFRQPAEAAEAITKGRIEILFIDALVAWRLAGQYETAGLTATTSLLTTESLAWAVRKGDIALLDAATDYHEIIRRDGQKTALMRRWLGAAYRPAQ